MLCSYKLSLHASLGYASFHHRDRTFDFCPKFYFTVLSGFQPNYAIKRDLRGNTGFKLIIGRVGPLFWLLGGISQKQNEVNSSQFFSAAFRLAFLVTSWLPAQIALGKFSVTPAFTRRLSRFVATS